MLFSEAQPPPIAVIARRAAVTASPYSPLLTFSMASRGSVPTFAAPPPSGGTGTTTARDVPAGAWASSLTHDSR